jgi:hypothetical protein
MNSRIKELIDQATFHGDRYALPDEFAEKLVDLVIRECMANLYLNGYDDAMIQLQKHFGLGE